DVADKKRLYAASARLYQEAFAAEPTAPADLRASYRYNAASAAAQAGCGRGQDDPPPDDDARARLRVQALAWLKVDLAARAKVLAAGPPEARAKIVHLLRHWTSDPGLAGLRGEALAVLPQSERADWRAFWADVEDLLARWQAPVP